MKFKSLSPHTFTNRLKYKLVNNVLQSHFNIQIYIDVINIDVFIQMLYYIVYYNDIRNDYVAMETSDVT